MRFEARELKSYASPVTADALKHGEVYLSVQFADENMLIAIVETWAFVGKGLDPENTERHLYFQDVESYLNGVRYGSPGAENATFQVALEGNTNHIFEYEQALEELMKCSLRRSRESG